MKTIFSTTFFLLMASMSFTQIKISGASNPTITSGSSNKGETNFVRKEVDVTKSTVEQTPKTQNFIIKNDYNESTVKTNNGKVSIQLDPLNSNNSTNQQMVIDMNKAKEMSVDTPIINNQTPNPIILTSPSNTLTTNPQTITSPSGNGAIKINGSENNTSTTVSPTNVTNQTTIVTTSAPETSPLVSKPNNSSSNSEYPKKNANHWAIGFNTGVPFVSGDVRSKLGYGGSITVQRALGHVVSLRYQSFFGQTFGQDWKLKGNETAYKNYKSRISDHSLQAVFSLNNINFYKRQPKVIFNVIAGVGFATRMSWVNNLDANGNAYDYSGVPVPVDKSSKKEILSAIDDIMDKGFETQVPNDKLSGHIKDTDINPAVMFGLGLGYRVSKRVDINLEHRVSWQNSDQLDAFTYGNNNDLLHYTSLGLNVKLGKKEDAMWWMNPIFAAYDDINALKKKVDEGELLKDEDKDGVADIFDKDLNTPENVPVNTHGVASDLDKDGVPDFQDKEPFTALGSKVDKDGKAIDTDKDGVIDLYDKDNNSPAGAAVNQFGQAINPSNVNSSYGANQGTAIANSTNATINSNKNEIGVVLFNNNSSVIPKDYYSELYKVLSVLKSNPNTKFLITGHADVKGSESYNLQLSKQRAESVYKMLTEVFKVPSSNLEINFVGENNPFVQGLPESYSSEYEPGHHLNRRVEITLK